MSWLLDQSARVRQWIGAHASLGTWILVASVVVSVGGLWAVRRLVLTIPADYFHTSGHHGWRERRPMVRWLLVGAKNVLGVVLFLLGLLMLVAPGPGVITLLLAVMLLDIPGKRQLEWRIVTLPSVLGAINRMRRRANRPELLPPAKEPER